MKRTQALDWERSQASGHVLLALQSQFSQLLKVIERVRYNASKVLDVGPDPY